MHESMWAGVEAAGLGGIFGAGGHSLLPSASSKPLRVKKSKGLWLYNHSLNEIGTTY